MIASHFPSTTIKQQLTDYNYKATANRWVQAMMDKNKKKNLLKALKIYKEPWCFSDLTTQSTFEFENASTNISSTSDASVISQSTISWICSPHEN